MNRIIDRVKDIERGYIMGQTEFKILCYADDAIRTTQDRKGIQQIHDHKQGADTMQTKSERPTDRTSYER